MTRDQLEHVIRASAAITKEYTFVIIGSQSLLGQFPGPHEVFTMSAEADIYPLDAPALADLIDTQIGEGSAFHDAFGYYAQGVGPETAILPRNWLLRVHRVQNDGTEGYLGLCLDVVDLFMSKAAAGRDKDRAFCMALFEYGYVQLDQVLGMVEHMPMEPDEQKRLRRTIQRWAQAVFTAR